MCLLTKWTEPKIATQDIECYKVVEKHDDGHWRTPFQQMRIARGGRYKCRAFQIKPFHTGGVDYGFHSFFFRQDAREQAHFFSIHFPEEKYAYVKCRIPAGSRYWEGTYGPAIGSYCSDTIIYETDDFNEIE